MANPPTTTRVTPTGIPLWDGYQTLLAFARDPDALFWEKTVQPPGYEGGDPIDQRTMHNTLWVTMRERVLIEVTEITMTVAYDPGVFTQLSGSLINQNGGVTWTLCDGSTIDCWGYCRSFIPNEVEDGTQPEAVMTVVSTNWDPANNVEAGPVITSVSGT